MKSIQKIPGALLAVLFLTLFATSGSVRAQSASVPLGTIYHDGGIRDLEAIGSRNVGCRKGIGNWYGIDKQIAMGKSSSQEVESSSKLITDPVIIEYVNRLGQNLVRNSDAQVPFTIKVIDSDEVNAFALPGWILLREFRPDSCRYQRSTTGRSYGTRDSTCCGLPRGA